MNKIRNKKSQGFTLIEILMTVGVILLTIMLLYGYYKKKNLDENIKLEVVYLKQIQNSIDNNYSAINNFSTLNSTNAILLGLIPQALILYPNTIVTTLGGKMDVKPSPTLVLGFKGYAMTLRNLTSESCSKLALTNYAYQIAQVLINGINAKTPGRYYTALQIANVTASCATSNNNSVEFRTYPISPQLLNTPNSSLNKIDEFYIPTVGDNVNSPGVPCSSGTTWNGSFCSCPVGNVWTGNSCIATDTTPASCQLGKGWNGFACAVLPATKPTFLRYPTPPLGTAPGPVPTLAGSVSSTTPAFTGNRWVASLPNPPIQEVTPQARCTNGGSWDGRVCNYCPDAASTVIKDSAGVVVITTPAHIAKSIWDGFRCVTPTSGW